MIGEKDMYRNPDDIKQVILNEVAKDQIRISKLSRHCYNEGTMWNVVR